MLRGCIACLQSLGPGVATPGSHLDVQHEQSINHPPKQSLTSRYLLYIISLPIFCLRLLTLLPSKALENMFFYRIISLFSSCRSFWRMPIVTCIKTMSLFGDVRTYPSWAPKTTCTTTHHNPQKTDQSDPTNLAGELLSIVVYGDDILSSSFSAKTSTHAAWP